MRIPDIEMGDIVDTITAREIFPYAPVLYLHSRWEGGTAVGWVWVDDISDGGVPVIKIPSAFGQDAYGYSSFVELSNFDYLQANHGDQLMRIAYVNVESLLVRADQPMPTSYIELTDEELDMLNLSADEADELQNLAYDLNRLAEYPVLDEDDWSQREWGAWVESWEPNGYNRADLESELGRSLTIEESERLPSVLEALDAYQGETEPGACYPECGISAIASELDRPTD